jgi:hypothetical protein
MLGWLCITANQLHDESGDNLCIGNDLTSPADLRNRIFFTVPYVLEYNRENQKYY